MNESEFNPYRPVEIPGDAPNIKRGASQRLWNVLVAGIAVSLPVVSIYLFFWVADREPIIKMDGTDWLHAAASFVCFLCSAALIASAVIVYKRRLLLQAALGFYGVVMASLNAFIMYLFSVG